MGLAGDFDRDVYYQHVLQMCQGDDLSQRMLALDELGKVYVDQVDGDFLLSLLRRASYYEEQRAILGIISQMGSRAPVAALLIMLADREAPRRHAVAGTLAALGEQAPVDLFIRLLQDPTEDVGLREDVAGYLGTFGARVPRDVLVAAVADPEACSVCCCD